MKAFLQLFRLRPLLTLTLFLVIVWLPKDALAGTFSVHGPELFTRASGTSVAVLSDVDVTNSGTYTLQISNGGLEDDVAEYVSSSVIKINGVQVVGPSEFNQNVTYIEKDISLNAGVNELSVELRGKPGGGISISIVGEDTGTDDDSDGVDNSLDLCPSTPAGEAVDANGCSATQLDDDGDGVNNALDQCPATPAGETVDANGCSDTQLDDDADGVNNALDQCPATPAGETVDANGCSATQLDDDADGVNNALDQCPATPAGETVDANGCSATQLDDDVDGVNNALDQCPATPAGEAVDANGCSDTQLDDDSDGVNNAIDQCPATPAGEAVDANGCSDTQLDDDSDGVSNAADSCPATPAGETVDANGCSATQLDDDADGVNNAADLCPATPAGETVDANGCSATQLDTDGDGVNDSLDLCPLSSFRDIVDANGCALWQLDTDGDGVSDASDQCPSTPTGETVNVLGCSATEWDSDNDGVNDAFDQCPSTPYGAAVDADGCSDTQRDTDGDGVVDASDQCPSTPTGEAADANGCSATERDTDVDGVNDALDQCPATPTGEAVDTNGCSDTQLDDDADGVSNAADLCPATPTGEAVDADGCSATQLDDDGDGVNNATDQCPTTPAGEAADANGCSATERDTDADGVNDALDLCPATPAGETADADGCIDSQRPPTVTITSPQTLTTVGSSPVDVTGTVSDDTVSLFVNGVQASVVGTSFSVSGIVIKEGMNTIGASAYDAFNNVGTDNVSITLDSTPPRVFINSPEDGAVVTSSPITVTGLINDIVRGTVNSAQASVTVNGLTATIDNRTFIVESVPLVEGLNTISAVGVDQTGNIATKDITVTLDLSLGKSLSIVSGNNQQAPIGSALPLPLVVSVTDEDNAPIAGALVIFEVIENDGYLDGAHRAVALETDVNGLAEVAYTIGTWAGSGNNKVKVTSTGISGSSTFVASGAASTAASIHVASGGQQRGAVNQSLPHPLVAIVTDAGHNCVENVPVTFTAVKGSGKFTNNQSAITVNTDSDGRAAASLVLGPESGNAAHVVQASFTGNTGGSAGFISTGLISGDPGQTSVSGVVLDNSNTPIPGVTMRIEGTTRQAVTDAEGIFTITSAPVGPIHLVADGSTATVPGEYPALMFELVNIAGQDNNLGMPIYLLALDITSSATVGGAEDVVYTLPEVPGFSLTVKAGSVTFPDGSTEGQISVTQVNADKIPMAPPNGLQPRFIITIQPPGAVFDPPAPITIPNVDGLAIGKKTNMYSFDHDLGQFVSIGTGTVSEDGSVIESDPGVGVIKAGWHCGGDPQPTGGANDCKECWECIDDHCKVDLSQNGVPLPEFAPDGTPLPDNICKECMFGNIDNRPNPVYDENGDIITAVQCDDKTICTTNDHCLDGNCTGIPTQEGGVCGAEKVCLETPGTCQNGECIGTVPKDIGDPVPNEECKECDGKGGTVNKPEDLSCTVDHNVCTDDKCMEGVCEHPNKEESTVLKGVLDGVDTGVAYACLECDGAGGTRSKGIDLTTNEQITTLGCGTEECDPWLENQDPATCSKSKCKFCENGSCTLGLKPKPVPKTCRADDYSCKINNVFREYTGKNAKATSENDGVHCGMSGTCTIPGCNAYDAVEETCRPVSQSFHYCGRAYDIRSKRMCHDLNLVIDAKLDVLLANGWSYFENIGLDNEHFHVRFPWITGEKCRNSVRCGGAGQPACPSCSWKPWSLDQGVKAGDNIRPINGKLHILKCTTP